MRQLPRRRAPLRLAALVVFATQWCEFRQPAGAASYEPPAATTDPRRLEPVYWREPTFFIPFQPDPRQFTAGTMREVRLLASRDGVAWSTLQQARPEVRGFSYRAPGDGEYFFAVQIADSSGRLNPPTVSAPQLRIVVDATKPQIEAAIRPAVAGSATLQYDLRDSQLDPRTLRIEVSEDGGAWRSVQVGPAEVTRPDRLMGSVTWSAASRESDLRFRIAVADRAGNASTYETTPSAPRVGPGALPAVPPTATSAPLAAAAVTGGESAAPEAPRFPDFESSPAAAGPAFTPPIAPSIQPQDGPSLGPAVQRGVANPFGAEAAPSLIAGSGAAATSPSSTSAPAAQDWPASNAPAREEEAGPFSLNDGVTTGGLTPSNHSLPPADNAYSHAGLNSTRAPAGGVPDDARSGSSFADRVPALAASTAGERTVFTHDPFAPQSESRFGESAARPFAAPPLERGAPANPFAAGLGSNSSPSPASPANSPGTPPGTMTVNSRTFEVDYDLSTAGDWGVARVELWGTTDDGATWQSFAVDLDNRSPVRVTAPGGGLFGLRIVIHGANAAATPPPARGERPEMFVYVDLHPPSVNLLGAVRGKGDQADMLRVRWSASDSNLADKPVTLLFSSHEAGPWSTAAANLDNTGEFFWRLQRHLPERVFLRVEVRDQGGNVGAAELKNPVFIEAPQPTGRLRSVRPASDATAR